MEFCGQRYPQSRNRLPISRSSVDLDSRTILGIGIAKWTINGERDTIIHVQGHKVLAFGSFFEYELSWQGICLAIYCGRLAERCVGRCPEFSEPNWHSSVIMFAWKSKKMALRACSANLWWERYGLCVLCSCCRQKTLGHGSRGTQWLWSHHYVQVISKSLPSQSRLTIVIAATEEAQTHEEATVYVKNGHILDWKSSKTRQQYCRLESFAIKTDIITNGYCQIPHLI